MAESRPYKLDLCLAAIGVASLHVDWPVEAKSFAPARSKTLGHEQGDRGDGSQIAAS